jgi:DNA adenine methylase
VDVACRFVLRLNNTGLEENPCKIDARFNRKELARRIERIALYRDRIKLFNLDAIDFLRKHLNVGKTAKHTLVYLDPPYFTKGSQLYLNYYEPDDHRSLSNYLAREARFLWVMTYDNAPAIRKLYAKFRQVAMNLHYSASDRRIGKEVIILHKKLIFPKRWKSRIPANYLTTAPGIKSL